MSKKQKTIPQLNMTITEKPKQHQQAAYNGIAHL